MCSKQPVNSHIFRSKVTSHNNVRAPLVCKVVNPIVKSDRYFQLKDPSLGRHWVIGTTGRMTHHVLEYFDIETCRIQREKCTHPLVGG